MTVWITDTGFNLCFYNDRARVTYQIVLTKTDMVPPVDLAKRCTLIMKELEDYGHTWAIKRVMMTSAATKAGLEELRKELASIALMHKPSK